MKSENDFTTVISGAQAFIQYLYKKLFQAVGLLIQVSMLQHPTQYLSKLSVCFFMRIVP